MTVYEKANIEEAVELAYALKEDGRYNWFRGQVRDWPPLSSLARMYRVPNSEAKANYDRRVRNFADWVARTPELRYLLEPEHVHDRFAIMQHYGIPTRYLDFTTDPGVAGFFAADTKKPPMEGKACIYCLNTDELMSLWNDLVEIDSRKGASIELVTINVRNLWRLQAQHGVFLFSNYNWDIDYPMDRILFAYSGYPSYPMSEQIYPKDKSPLEQLLDQYFSLEQADSTIQILRQRDVTVIQSNVLPGGFLPEAFVNESRLVPLDSWNRNVLQPWELDPVENYRETIGPTVRLRIDPTAGTEKIMKSAGFGVNQILRTRPAIRSKTVDWVITGLPEPSSQETLGNTLRPVWNGMRRLPFKDGEIADAMGSAVALSIMSLGKQVTGDAVAEWFSQRFGQCMRVGFSDQDGSGSVGLVARDSIRRALRPDIAELLVPKYAKFADDVYNLLQLIYNPRLMFDFDEFKSMFAREAIPTQAVLQREPIIFNPVRLKFFGIP